MIEISCESCGRFYRIPPEHAGRKARCRCGVSVQLPTQNGNNGNGFHALEPLSATPPAAAPMTAEQPMPGIIARQPSMGVADISTAAIPQLAAGAPISIKSNSGKLPMRTRRLMADAQAMHKAFDSFSLIRVKSTTGNPPDVYQIEYLVKGLEKGKKREPVVRESHLVEVQLTSDYPRLGPKCRMLTPVFHPNIDLASICVGDHWTAGERLADLVVRIGQMITFQDYNIKSPLDGEAAMWADLNREKLPLDTRNLYAPQMET